MAAAEAARPAPSREAHSGQASQEVLGANASNELIFAVVGHVGSGTSLAAELLKAALEKEDLRGEPYEVRILKARDEILAWAEEAGEPAPAADGNNLEHVTRLQDLGDSMRLRAGDNAAVARALIASIRVARAHALGLDDPGPDVPVLPDGKRRAYILDSIRHPAEVHLLRRVYHSAFTLIGVVCDDDRRLRRITGRYTNAGDGDAQRFMARDAKAGIPHGQRVYDTFHLADFFLDNSTDRTLPDKSANPHWDVAEQLSRLVKIVTHLELIRPTIAETAMYTAHGAQIRSACMSRQVGAALIDRDGNLIATGTNEVPKAGGGLYGEQLESQEAKSDSRCAFRQLQGNIAFCSNTREHGLIAEELLESIARVITIKGNENSLRSALRDSRIGELIEFSRAVHAEMDALLSAARLGVSPRGARLFVTTFPCHYCARHAVSAGVDEVQYIEPYPKSKALDMHADSITRNRIGWQAPSDGGTHVLFRPFVGVAPRLYARAFLKDRELKDKRTGEFHIGEPDAGDRWDMFRISYPQLEVKLSQTPQGAGSSNTLPAAS